MKLDVPVEKLKGFSLFIGTPMYGGACSGVFTKSTNDLSTLCNQYGIGVSYYYLFNESLIPRARNYIADEFLRSNCTHLMFIDADIGFSARDVLSLLAIQISDPEKYQVMAATYPKKTIAWEKVKQAVEAGKANDDPNTLQEYAADFVFNPLPTTTSFRIDEPVEVMETGTGFMLIPREALEKFAAANPQMSYKPDHLRSAKFDGSTNITAFFHCEIDPSSGRYLSEDYYFCQQARKIGINVHLCPWMTLYHVGSYTFRGSLAALASISASPTVDPSVKKSM